ncbi:MAG: hypothetical protein AB1775_14235 [Bacteroidota bacterium]
MWKDAEIIFQVDETVGKVQEITLRVHLAIGKGLEIKCRVITGYGKGCEIMFLIATSRVRDDYFFTRINCCPKDSFGEIVSG